MIGGGCEMKESNDTKKAVGSSEGVIDVLLVDDHEATREELRLLLSQQPGIAVTGVAGSGEEAVEKARGLKPRVVVMDIALPGMTGVEATRLIVSERPQTTVLALSNYSGKGLVQSIQDAGAAGYVRKDRAFEELLPAILAVAAGRKFLGKDVQKE
jgi:DNA-binding NarL/FixJ family response regulator